MLVLLNGMKIGTVAIFLAFIIPPAVAISTGLINVFSLLKTFWLMQLVDAPVSIKKHKVWDFVSISIIGE